MSFDHVEVVRKAVQTKMSIEKCYKPENTGFGIFDGVVGTAFSLLAKTKKERFTIKKPTNKITDADIMEHLQKGLSYITKRDFTKFRKSVKELKTSNDYTDDAKGFARYLDTIIWEVGYLGLSIIIFKNDNPQADPIEIAKHNHDFALDIFNYCTELAEIIYPSGKEYGKTLQGVMLNELTRMGRRTGANEPKQGDALFYTGENVSLAFLKSSKYGGQAMTIPMHKVSSMYHEELCKKLPADLSKLGKVTLDELGTYSKVRISLDSYMELTKTKDKKTARKTIEEACDRLYEISFITMVNHETYKGRLFQSQMTKQRGGIYEMEFSNDFLRYCATTTPAAFHKGMYQINGKTNPYAWSIGEKLRWYYEINRGREQATHLSVAKLLEAVPDIPTYDEVMSSKTRAVARRIIEPIERDLDELQRLGVLKSWEYSNTKGLPLTKEQAENMNYETWSGLYIMYKLNLPPQDHYIEQRGKRIAKAKERAAKKKEVSKNGG